MAVTPTSTPTGSGSQSPTTRPSSAGPITPSDADKMDVDAKEGAGEVTEKAEAEGLGADAPFEDVSLEGLTGKEGREAKEKLAKLNYLLKASGIYSKIIADNIARSQKQRADADAKAEKKAEQAAAAADGTAEAAASKATRHSSRTGATTTPAEAKKGAAKRKTRASAGGKKASGAGEEDGGDAPEKSELLKEQAEAAPEGQPKLLTGATMRGYQLAGMHWLATLYEQGLNGILADEMGLGKTLQTIAFLCYLRERAVWGPFLIVCPLSTVANWVNEFERFCPDFPVVLYHGSIQEREEIRMSRLGPPSDAKGAFLGAAAVRGKTGGRKSGGPSLKSAAPNTTATFPVVVTSYELVMNDRKWLGQYAWRFIVVDESHRLKNLECKLVQELKSYTSANRLLLTGTPLHNNLKELWSLLNFILPEVFDDYSSFEQWFDLSSVTAGSATSSARALSDAQTQHIVSNLHAILKPFLLRRMKADVETSLPKKKEYLLSAPLTAQQKELYDAVINRSLRTFLLDKHDKNASSVDQSEAEDEEEEEEEAKETESESEGPARKRRRTSGRTSGRVTGKAKKGKSKKTDDSDSSDSDSSDEELLANTSRRTHVQRKKSKRDYAERTDAQFFREVDAGVSSEIRDLDSGAASRALSRTVSVASSRELRALEAKRGVNQLKLQNVVMQLRKVCNHPWLFDWPVDRKTGEYVINDGLIAASGKMLLLDRLLEGLFARGHKVLLFSQFTSMLDIIQDWANELKGWTTCRIDGTTKQEDRRQQMKDFNESTGDDASNLFLLSTRAGGVGINLVAADTVILFDSDWNPQQDLQAQDRAHRIGQTKPVLVFRLVSGNTVESKILQRAGEKRKLEALVIGQGFNVPGADVSEIFGGKRRQQNMTELAETLLRTDGEKITLAEQGDEILDDDTLESLLDRSDEAMERKLGWAAKSLVSGGAAMEVYETKPANEPDPVAEILKGDEAAD